MSDGICIHGIPEFACTHCERDALKAEVERLNVLLTDAEVTRKRWEQSTEARAAQKSTQGLVNIAESLAAGAEQDRDEALRLLAEARAALAEAKVDFDTRLFVIVKELGGTVEDHPTSRINYLQRIRELRTIEVFSHGVEKAADYAAKRCDTAEADLANARAALAELSRSTEHKIAEAEASYMQTAAADLRLKEAQRRALEAAESRNAALREVIQHALLNVKSLTGGDERRMRAVLDATPAELSSKYVSVERVERAMEHALQHTPINEGVAIIDAVLAKLTEAKP